MAHEVVMPQLGLSMDSGQIIQWLKQDGDAIRPGDLLLEVESDKSVVEVEAVEQGTLRIMKGPQDGPVAVGSVIAYLVADGEAVPAVIQPAKKEDGAAKAAPSIGTIEVPRAASPAETRDRAATARSSPAARRRAQELGVDWRQATPSGTRGQIKERDVVALAASGTPGTVVAQPGQVRISPVALRMAQDAGIEVSTLAAQHPGKRLERSDVEGVLRGPAPMARAGVGVMATSRQPAGALRKLIADRMALSSHTTAPVTLTTEADATDLVKMREGWKADARSDFVPSYTVLFAALAARALVEHPYMNTSFDGDNIVTWGTANIGVAVDTERGLIVPVVRDAQTKPLRGLASEMGDLLARASQGKALPDELKGGTFTITNLGVYDIDAFTPIINYPECAVLGIGRLVERIVPVASQPAVRTMVALSLTFDHRLVDGAPAARFLQRVKQFVEQPYLWMV
jgi:pyruvate dehydrogenase E2 component (dihydrolipoamide acetyltransferase)